jgi:putative RNA 2'-phosphotransferase
MEKRIQIRVTQADHRESLVWVPHDGRFKSGHPPGKLNALEPAIIEVVATSDKQRFALSPDERSIRANQGHSTEVDLALAPLEPPELLYHGTVERFLDSIRREGLVRGKRQHVHLSPDRETAARVGARRGMPVILVVETARLHRAGHSFLRSEDGVWLTDAVPPEYLQFPDV